MQVNKITKTVLVLELTEEEARWLHDFVQNSRVEVETVQDSTMRERFFTATMPA